MDVLQFQLFRLYSVPNHDMGINFRVDFNINSKNSLFVCKLFWNLIYGTYICDENQFSTQTIFLDRVINSFVLAVLKAYSEIIGNFEMFKNFLNGFEKSKFLIF